MKRSILLILVLFVSYSLSAKSIKGIGKDTFYTAQYEVPVDNQSLKQSALFSFKVKERKLSSGQVKLNYDLPMELIGVEQDIALIGNKNDPSTFKGPDTVSNCVKGAELQIVCLMQYKLVQGTELDVVEYLQTQNLTPQQFADKLAVSKLFRCGPIGILSIGPKPISELDIETQKLLQEKLAALKNDISASCAE